MRIVLVIFALMCGAAASQFPEFHQQYLQRLGGTLDELDRQVDALDMRANEAGLERYPYIRRLLNNDDVVVQREGQNLLDMVTRRLRIEQAIAELREIPGYLLAFKTALYFETDIARNTAIDYKPAVPLTLSGIGHAIAGFFLGYILPLLLRMLFPRRVPVSA